MKNIDKKFLTLFLFLLLIIAFVYFLPHLIRYNELSSQNEEYFAWTHKSNFDVLNVHGTRYRNIIDHNFFIGDIDSYEYRNFFGLWPMLSADLIITLLLILTQSITATIVITDVIFPILVFITFFFLINGFARNKYFSLSAAFLLIFFSSLFTSIPPSSLSELRNIFSRFMPIYFFDSIKEIPLRYVVRDSFIPSALYFLLFIFFTHKTLTSSSKRYLVAGFFFASLSYLYLHYWIFASIFLGLLFILFLFIKKYQQAKDLVYIGVVGLFFSIPFWVSHYFFSSLSYYDEIMSRVGLELGHSVRFFLWKTYLLYALYAFIVLWLGFKLKKKVSHFYIAVLSLAQIFVLNLQVVTGFNIQSDHYSTRVFIIVNGIVLSVIFYYFYLYLNRKFNLLKVKKIFVVVVPIVFLSIIVNIVYSQLYFEKKHAELYSIPQNYIKAYEWFNKNTPRDSVIMTPDLETNAYLSAYTHNKIFLLRGQTTIAPESEIIKRFLISNKYFNIDSSVVNASLDDWKTVFYLFLAQYNSRELDASFRPTKYDHYILLPDVKIKIYDDYLAYDAHTKIPYRFDYIFLGPNEKKMGAELFNQNNLIKVYDRGDIEIYKNIAVYKE